MKLQDSSGPEGPGCESRHSEISQFPKSTLKHIHRPRTDIIQSLMTSNNPEGDEWIQRTPAWEDLQCKAARALETRVIMLTPLNYFRMSNNSSRHCCCRAAVFGWDQETHNMLGLSWCSGLEGLDLRHVVQIVSPWTHPCCKDEHWIPEGRLQYPVGLQPEDMQLGNELI